MALSPRGASGLEGPHPPSGVPTRLRLRGERPDLRFPKRVGENCPLAARRLLRLALSLTHNCPLARPHHNQRRVVCRSLLGGGGGVSCHPLPPAPRRDTSGAPQPMHGVPSRLRLRGERPDLRFPNHVGENCPLAARRLFRLALSLSHNCPLAQGYPAPSGWTTTRSNNGRRHPVVIVTATRSSAVLNRLRWGEKAGPAASQNAWANRRDECPRKATLKCSQSSCR
jgi:hypothetical protein